MTRTRPLRRMTLHFSQILLTEGRTFIALSFRKPYSRTSYLHTQPQVFVFEKTPSRSPADGHRTCSLAQSYLYRYVIRPRLRS